MKNSPLPFANQKYPVAFVLKLQRTVGNRQVARLLNPPPPPPPAPAALPPPRGAAAVAASFRRLFQRFREMLVAAD